MGWLDRWDEKNQAQAVRDNEEAPELDAAISQIFGWRELVMALGFFFLAAVGTEVLSTVGGGGWNPLVSGATVGAVAGVSVWLFGRVRNRS